MPYWCHKIPNIILSAQLCYSSFHQQQHHASHILQLATD